VFGVKYTKKCELSMHYAHLKVHTIFSVFMRDTGTMH